MFPKVPGVDEFLAYPRGLRLLFLLNQITEQSCPYNEFCLPLSRQHDVCVVSFFPPEIDSVPASIRVFSGRGSVRWFLHALTTALRGQEFDLVHVHSPQLGFLYLAHILSREGKANKSVYTVHSSFTNENLKFRNKLLFIPVFLGFDRVVFVSEASRTSFPRLYRRLSGGGARVITSGVDLNRIDRCIASMQPARSAAKYRIASVGRLISIKGPLTLLEAFRRVGPGVWLEFLGDGELRELLEDGIRRAELQHRVRLRGGVPRETVYRVLAEADLFVSTSRGEALPISVLEAMACRCPVVLSDIPPHREIAAGSDFIRLVAPDDVEGFAREIRRFREMSLEDRLNIGRSCRELVERRFSLTAMQVRYEELFREILASYLEETDRPAPDSPAQKPRVDACHQAHPQMRTLRAATQKWKPETWISIKRTGSHRYFISQDGRFFFKQSARGIDKLRKEYRNLKVLSHIEVATGLHFLRPVAVLPSLKVLVTEYVKGKSLASIRDPEAYYLFGQKLRSFHDRGHTHGHLQVNDIIYAGGVFVVSDLVYLDERPAVHDLANFKLSCQIFRLKRPWRWTSYVRCYAAFRAGYGFWEDDVFKHRSDDLLNRWMMRLRKRSFQSKWLEATVLRLAIAMRLIG